MRGCPDQGCDGLIRGCVWGAWADLADAGEVPPPSEAHHQDHPASYHRIKSDLEAAYKRLGRGDHDLPGRVAAEFLNPSVPTQGVLL